MSAPCNSRRHAEPVRLNAGWDLPSTTLWLRSGVLVEPPACIVVILHSVDAVHCTRPDVSMDYDSQHMYTSLSCILFSAVVEVDCYYIKSTPDREPFQSLLPPSTGWYEKLGQIQYSCQKLLSRNMGMSWRPVRQDLWSDNIWRLAAEKRSSGSGE